MMSVAAFVLLSTTLWTDPVDIGEFFVVPISTIMDTQQKSEDIKWQTKKDLRDNFMNPKTTLKLLFEHIFDLSYHLVGMRSMGFGTDEPPTILKQASNLYGMPSLGKLNLALL